LFIRSSLSGIIVVQCSPASTSQVVGAAVGAVGTVGVGRGINAAGVGRTVRRGVESTGVGVGRGSHQGGGRTVGGLLAGATQITVVLKPILIYNFKYICCILVDTKNSFRNFLIPSVAPQIVIRNHVFFQSKINVFMFGSVFSSAG